MDDKKKKKIIIFLVVILVVLLVVVIGFTSAHFLAPDEIENNTDIKVQLSENALLTFSKTGKLKIDAGLDNFRAGDGNSSSTITSTATLTSPGVLTTTYNAYIVINYNDFIYTTEEETPELVLTIQKPDGNYVTSINGLDNTTVDGKAGFDVTTEKGMFIIEENIVISTTEDVHTNVDDYIVTLYFINLETSQNANGAKTFDTEFLLLKDKYIAPAADALIALHGEADGLYQHTPELLNSAGDNNYRYSGANPDNYVMFNDELWRVIGIFDINGRNSLKLIRNESIGNRVMESGNDNRWEGANTSVPSDDADMNKYLNGEYYNNLLSNAKEMIKETKYNTGSFADDNTSIKNVFTLENASITVNMYNVGLMYMSDYGYATTPTNWDQNLSSTGLGNENWLFQGVTMWSIVPRPSDSSHIWILTSRHVFFANASQGHGGSFPVLYLKSNIKILSGTGSEADPFLLGF